MNSKIIAFYLPQYHPTATNDLHYGKGFTEWTNVGKAKALFHGHYQPKVPADLGYYDLRIPEVRQMQAEFAKEAGIYGFCYYHYWFSSEHQELDLPFKEVVNSKSPDFPFCLCWANQSWYSKFWSFDRNCVPKLVAQQTYEDSEGIKKHFFSLLDAFRDKRYIRVDGRLLFMIYRPLEFPGVKDFMSQWQALAKEHGLGGFFFTAQATNDSEIKKIMNLGFDGVNIVRMHEYTKHFPYNNIFYKFWCKFLRLLGQAPYHVDYRKIMKYFFDPDVEGKKENVFPTIIPNWDHSPRSGKRGTIFTNSTPQNFKKHCRQVLSGRSAFLSDTNLIFLKSWNEWGEGNYMEPDLKYGKKFIETLREVIDQEENK